MSEPLYQSSTLIRLYEHCVLSHQKGFANQSEKICSKHEVNKMASSLPPFPTFDITDQSSLNIRFNKYLDRFDNFIAAMGITNANRKKAMLLHYAGESVHDIYDTLTPMPEPGEGEDVFTVTRNKLKEHFEPHQNDEYQKFVFRQTLQNQGETLDQYHVRLKALAKTCNFTNANGEIKSQLIFGGNSFELKTKILADPTMTLDQILNLGRRVALSTEHAKAMTNQTFNGNINNIVHKKKPDKQSNYTRPSFKQNNVCGLCGGNYPHPGGPKSCPAYNKTCNRCGKLNHYARCCRSNPKNDHPKSYYQKHQPKYSNSHAGGSRPPARRATVNQVSTQSSDEEEEYVYLVKTSNKQQLPHATVNMNNTPIHMMIDSGATINIIDEGTFAMIHPQPEMVANNVHIKPYGTDTDIENIGRFLANIQHKSKNCNAYVYVVKGHFGSLLSYHTATELGLLKIVNQVTDSTVLDEFPGLFDNKIGCLTNFKVKLHVDQDVQPISQPHRRIPFHLRKKVEQKLQELEDNDLIEEVEGPTPWVSPIVTPPKPNNPEEIRLCVDMRSANKAIKRTRHITPTIEDVLSDLNGSTVFSKLDLNQGYHQLLLDDESRYITTFSTHVGLRRYKRLSFGINCASEIFQNALHEVIADLPGAINISDDILVYASNRKEHDIRLQNVLSRLQDRGLTLNKKKCQFYCKSLGYMGYVFTDGGIMPDPKKVEAIQTAPAPTNSAEVRSLLGLATYCSRFIQNFSSITEPMRKLTKEGTQFVWTESQQSAFDKLKASLTADSTMAYFDPKLPTEVIVDASPVGLGAILAQRHNDNVKIISYASRALTPVESRYSQTEREALGIVFGCERFHLYLFGSEFNVVTDHKPLVPMFNHPHSKLPARIERWLLRLQQYNMTVIYRSGKENPADYMSRHPTSSTYTERSEKVTEEYINFLAHHCTPKAMSLDEVKTETLLDPVLQQVITCVRNNQWHNIAYNSEPLNSYYRVRQELCVTDDIILRNQKLVLPEKLHQRAVELAHIGHQGIDKTKSLMREKVWFPKLDRMVEKHVKECVPCQASVLTYTKEPLKMSTLPPRPWSEISVDFYGPVPSGEYLIVVIDDFSRFPIVEIIHSTSSRAVIPCLDKIMSIFGIPDILKSDNGPPFDGHEFRKFADYMGFKHKRITPNWPQANGEAERFMRTLTKAIHSAISDRKPWKQYLHQFLRNYRVTPHKTTNQSPSFALFGRNVKSTLPDILEESQDTLMKETDYTRKMKMKTYADKKHAKSSTIEIGDTVLVRQKKQNKFTTPYNCVPMTVTGKNGCMITAANAAKSITRNISLFKKLPINLNDNQAQNNSVDSDMFDLYESDNIQQQQVNLPVPQAVPIAIPYPRGVLAARGGIRRYPVRRRQAPGYLRDYRAK